MITFAIPGYKRPNKVYICVRSIADQIVETKVDARIFISEHSEDEDTWNILRRLEKDYPFIELHCLPRQEGHDYSHNFQETFKLAQGDWIWTFGNDDVLLPGALGKAIGLINALPDVEFIHVSEESRTENTNSVIRGTLLQLCEQLGWLDMTGYITCNLIKGERLNEAASLPSWPIYAHNSFVQSCVLLEVLHGKRCAFVDVPLVKPQNPEITQETLDMWNLHQVAKRYFYVDEALKDMRGRGLLGTLNASFFRYHSYYLWDRLITNMVTQYINHPEDQQSELWENIEGLFEFLDEDDRKVMNDRIFHVKEAIGNHMKAMEEHKKMSIVLDMFVGGHNVERFGFTYLGKPKQP